MSLAEKIDFLFRTVHPAGRGEYTYKEVEQELARMGHRVSDSALHQLRKGIQSNPTLNTLAAIARFFGVPPSYFFDDRDNEAVRQELQLLASLRDEKVRSIATRAFGLTEDNLRFLSQVIDAMEAMHARTDPTDATSTTSPTPRDP